MPTASYGATDAPKQSAADIMRTKILMLGMRRCGKTSILEVLFNDCSPKQSFYLERTTRITKRSYDTVIPLEIWDCPGDVNPDTLDAPLSQFATLVFVIDIQDMYLPPITRLVDFIVASYHDNPTINLEVFVHKGDTLSEEYRIENFRYIQQRVLDELAEQGPEYEQIPINFQLTSIHDYTLRDAFSRMLHKSIEALPFLEDLLNVFCANSLARKAFLFDIKSRLYVATDASPVDPNTHNLCDDYLLMLNSFGPLYRSITASPQRHRPPTPPSPQLLTPTPAFAPALAPFASSSTVTPRAPNQPTHPSPSTSPTHSSSLSLSRASASTSAGPTSTLGPTSTPITPGSATAAPTPRRTRHLKSSALFYPSASASLSSSSTVRIALSPPAAGTGSGAASGGLGLGAGMVGIGGIGTGGVGNGGGMTLMYHVITPSLALLALLPTEVYEQRRGLVEYNVVFFREGVQEICEVESEVRGGGAGGA